MEAGRGPLGSSFEADFPSVSQQVQPKAPCYFAVRLDSKNMNGFEWLLCVYIPEGSPVKERMIYASTREILKRQLGTSYFGDGKCFHVRIRSHLSELFGTTKEELSLEAYKAHKTKLAADQPLTSSELQARQESTLEVGYTYPYSEINAFADCAGRVEGVRPLRPLPSVGRRYGRR